MMRSIAFAAINFFMVFKWINSDERYSADEYYTQLGDIESELSHYTDHFSGKVIYCNCDNPKTSNFVRYFRDNFRKLGLKKLIATNFVNSQLDIFGQVPREDPYITIITRAGTHQNKLAGDGDFRSFECVDLLKSSDIVATNPPFSLFRRFLNLTLTYKKNFIALGSTNAMARKDVYNSIVSGEFWAGVTPVGKHLYFDVSAQTAKRLVATKQEGISYKIVNGEVKSEAPCHWYTNLHHHKRDKYLPLISKYCPNKYPKYDNYDAIDVPFVADIPSDYSGLMGVPITYIGDHCPRQFRIIDIGKPPEFTISGRAIYARFVIKKRV